MTYRLLRDNKETGPFSEEEMIAKGFKPYDLIWVEGKSAGWRYPSEIPAFKSFAPIVEEQPYDRFYKKQPAQKLVALEERLAQHVHDTAAAKAKENIQPLQKPAAQPAIDYTMLPSVQSSPGKHIHVTLPSGNTINLTAVVAKKEHTAATELAETKKILAVIENKQQDAAEPVYRTMKPVITKKDTIIPAADPVVVLPAALVADDRGADNKPVYANWLAVVNQFTGNFSWSLAAAACIGIATLVGLGIMIGLSMNHEKNDIAFTEAMLSKSKQTVHPRNDSNIKPAGVSTAGDAASIAGETLPSGAAGGKELVQNAVVKRTISQDNNSDIKELKKLPQENITTQKTNFVSGQVAPVSLPAKLHPSVINIEKTLSLTANDFKAGAFGGISGLKCTLFNGSRLSLESVEAEVDYIQANNKVYKTEKILFKDIAAGTQAIIEAPASSRGVKVITRIIKVNAKEASVANTTAKS